MVRLRAYPEGKVRDYLGERYFERPSYEERYAKNLDELCSDMPELELGREITLRRGAPRRRQVGFEEALGGFGLGGFGELLVPVRVRHLHGELVRDLAAAVGGKRAAMADRTLAERATGYVRGGISPLGQRRRLRTVIDSSAES